MAYKKKQHFVPQCYLKSWTTDDNLYSMPKIHGLTRKQSTKEVAKKNHLYTLPSTFFDKSDYENPDLQELITESIIFKTWEDKWGNVRNLLSLHFDLTKVLHSIKGFVITQSFRTPKFMRLNKKKLERMGKTDDNVADSYQYAFLGTAGLTNYIENCICEIAQNLDISNFITCDNPATHWLQEGEIYHHLNGIALNTDLYKNPNYKIICPLSPKYVAVLSPNLGIKVNENDKNKVWIKAVNNATVLQFNQMIEHGADKMLFAKDLKDFI